MFRCLPFTRKVSSKSNASADVPPAYDDHFEENALAVPCVKSPRPEAFRADVSQNWSMYHLVTAGPAPSLWTQTPDTQSGNTYTFDVAFVADKLDDIHLAFT
jgi:hypothetical protein